MAAAVLRLPPQSSRATRAMVTLAAWLSIAILVLAACIISYNMRGLTARNQRLGQVYDVQLASEQLMADLLDAETGQRGYLLTGDPGYLGCYTTARGRIDADFARLRAAPLGNAARAAQINVIEALTTAKLAGLARMVALTQAGQPAAALQLMKRDQGKHTMDAIRAQMASLQQAADDDLPRRPAGAPWDAADVMPLIPLAAVLLVGVLWFKRRIELDISSRFYRLERFTRAFGLAKGILYGMDGRILFWDDGAARQFGYTPEEALGRIHHELLQLRFADPAADPAADRQALLLQHGAWQGEFTCRHKDGRELRMLGGWTLSRGKAGEPDVVIDISTDITAIKAAEQAHANAHAVLQTIVETTPGLIYAKDRQGRMVMANAAALALIGKPWCSVQGRTDMEFLDDPAQGALIVANDRRIMERGEAEELEEEVGAAGSAVRVFQSIKTPLRDADAVVVGLVGVSIDITERKRGEDRLRQMVNELNHRVKNTLASVQAIASRTLGSGDPLLREKLEARLMALAGAHDVLTRERWVGAELHDVVSEALAAFGGRTAGRFRVQGPPLRLNPRAAIALAMGLHELSINAAKYGALSTPAGRVEIIWDVAPTAEALFCLIWTERGGPPVVAPLKYGFGVRLIERSLSQDLGGAAAVHFDDAQGLRCVVEVPLAEIAAAAGEVALLRVGAEVAEEC